MAKVKTKTFGSIKLSDVAERHDAGEDSAAAVIEEYDRLGPVDAMFARIERSRNSFNALVSELEDGAPISAPSGSSPSQVATVIMAYIVSVIGIDTTMESLANAGIAPSDIINGWCGVALTSKGRRSERPDFICFVGGDHVPGSDGTISVSFPLSWVGEVFAEISNMGLGHTMRGDDTCITDAHAVALSVIVRGVSISIAQLQLSPDTGRPLTVRLAYDPHEEAIESAKSGGAAIFRENETRSGNPVHAVKVIYGEGRPFWKFALANIMVAVHGMAASGDELASLCVAVGRPEDGDLGSHVFTLGVSSESNSGCFFSMPLDEGKQLAKYAESLSDKMPVNARLLEHIAKRVRKVYRAMSDPDSGSGDGGDIEPTIH